MNLSKQDMFSDNQQIGATGDTASTDTLDFNAHGDDILGKLFLCVLLVGAIAGDGSVKIIWQTCDDEDFESGVVETDLTPAALTADDEAGTYVVRNAPLPRGLKRYNRLSYEVTLAEGEEMTAAPVFSAFIVDGRDEPLA